ncbi:MAG: HEPN domain-containing protein [Acidobacteria bacterium]|nr:HEPN domain-containing protein [Acidobacteriota bacterium]
MPQRWADWWRQSDADLSHARHALEDGHHEWACFAAQQAAEKALKAVHDARGQDTWGHSVTELLEALRRISEHDADAGPGDTAAEPVASDSLVDRARALDKLYIPTRYPNGLPAGAPADYYTRVEAERAIADAEAIIACCRRMLPG